MNVVITGASKGIGFEIAKKFINDSNNQVVLIARTIENQTIFQNKNNVHLINFNFENGNIQELYAIIENKIKHIDILINNAGALINKPFEKITQDEIYYIYKVNTFAPFMLCQILMPLLYKSKKAHIVNIGSMGGYQSSAKFSGLSIYSSSKAALANLSECLAEELKNTNIACNCLALGAAQTEMLKEAFPDYIAPISATEMASYIVEFSINGNKYFNGKVIPVSLSTP
jgi:3-oxoacyl-[acyl-carrier protein] reductase